MIFCIIDDCDREASVKGMCFRHYQQVRRHGKTFKDKRNELRPDNSSGYRGVYRFRGKWRAVIYVNKKRMELGLFKDPREAAWAYNKAAKFYLGEESLLNLEDGKPLGKSTLSISKRESRLLFSAALHRQLIFPFFNF